jgi:peptidoglycan hydrolase-like protein with peptidoglycan-binding domain
MKYFALGILLATTAVVGAPAHSAEWKESNRLNGYYSAAERDHVIKEKVALSKGDVKNVQIALRNAGYKPGKIDGVYGRETTAAVKKFQKDRNLISSGKVDARTLGALRVNTRLDEDHRLTRNYN